MQRRDIAAVEWIELAIHMESATAQRWGHDRAPQWTRDGGDGAPVWGDGYFDKAPVYTDLLICSVSGSLKGLFVAPAENGVCDDEARAIITTEQVKRGGFISQNDAAKIVRAALPKFPRDRARDIAKSVTGNGKRGPRGPRKNCAE
ncbi:hypothetical protein LG047_02510 [Methylocystis sp. WRRC1]|nr:hypothetical protein [Methylocystis sp. WRRC1]MCC3244204.1 hypothetical protein [Methylocystis sp. WRRC1]